jgi:hypothetical protein
MALQPMNERMMTGRMGNRMFMRISFASRTKFDLN